MVDFRRKIGKAKIRSMAKMFEKSMEHLREKVGQGEIIFVKDTLTDQCLNGLDTAETVLNDPDRFKDDEARSIIEAVDIDQVQHRKTREFMHRIRDVEGQDELLDLIDDFETYYINRLKEMN